LLIRHDHEAGASGTTTSSSDDGPGTLEMPPAGDLEQTVREASPTHVDV